jgi:hypothetical protein
MSFLSVIKMTFWEFQRRINVSYSPSYSINNNGTIYILSQSSIYKYDKYLNLTKQTNSFCSLNRGIFFNLFNRFIYAACSKKIIQFDENLNQTPIFVTVYQTRFITGYNDQMIVGDNDNGKVYFYQNNAITKTISTKYTVRVSSILYSLYY